MSLHESYDNEEFEYVLLNLNEAFVYKLPQRSPRGHLAQEWKDCIWKGKVQIVGKGKLCTIRLIEKQTGELFAACPVPEGDEDKAVERTIDSSRYFVVRLDDGRGRFAFVGLGFEQRNDAFDFFCTIIDFLRTSKGPILNASHDQRPSKDYSLKAGEKLKIDLKGVWGTKDGHHGNDHGNTHTHTNSSFGLLPPPPVNTNSRRKTTKPQAGTASPSTASPPLATSSQASTSSSTHAHNVIDDMFEDCTDFVSAPTPPQSDHIPGLHTGASGAESAPVQTDTHALADLPTFVNKLTLNTDTQQVHTSASQTSNFDVFNDVDIHAQSYSTKAPTSNNHPQNPTSSVPLPVSLPTHPRVNPPSPPMQPPTFTTATDMSGHLNTTFGSSAMDGGGTHDKHTPDFGWTDTSFDSSLTGTHTTHKHVSNTTNTHTHNSQTRVDSRTPAQINKQPFFPADSIDDLVDSLPVRSPYDPK